MKRRRTGLSAAAALLAVLLLGAAVLAQGSVPGIGRWVLGNGGGTAEGENVSLAATLGQPIVGYSGGGSISLGAGFWRGGAVEGPPSGALRLPMVLR